MPTLIQLKKKLHEASLTNDVYHEALITLDRYHGWLSWMNGYIERCMDEW